MTASYAIVSDGEFVDPDNLLPVPSNVIADVLSSVDRTLVIAADGEQEVPWQIAVGSVWAVVAGSARPSTQVAGIQVLTIDALESDGAVETVIGAVPATVNGNFNGSGVVFRYVDAANYWSVEWVFGSGMSLVKRAGGTATVVASIAGNPVVGERIKATFVGDTIDVLVGAAPLTTTDAVHRTAMLRGLACRYTSSSASAIKFSSFKSLGVIDLPG